MQIPRLVLTGIYIAGVRSTLTKEPARVHALFATGTQEKLKSLPDQTPPGKAWEGGVAAPTQTYNATATVGAAGEVGPR